jgi:hypothetical protein
MEGGSPTIRRRRLGRALRDLRVRAGLTGSAAGAAVERSGSWISRVEGGRVGLRGRDLRDLLDLYELRDARRRDELEALAREGKQRGWWSKYAEDLPELLVVYIGLEDEARAIRGFQDGVVPGLLQTESYCRAVISQSLPVLPPMSPAEIESRVEVRMARQAHVHRKPVQLQYLLDEAVLYRTIGGTETLGEQLEHLSMVAREPHIDIRAVPFTRGDRIVPAGSFSIMSFPQDPDAVWHDLPAGHTYLDEDEDVEMYNRILERLTEAALDPEETSELIREAKGKLR